MFFYICGASGIDRRIIESFENLEDIHERKSIRLSHKSKINPIRLELVLNDRFIFVSFDKFYFVPEPPDASTSPSGGKGFAFKFKFPEYETEKFYILF